MLKKYLIKEEKGNVSDQESNDEIELSSDNDEEIKKTVRPYARKIDSKVSPTSTWAMIFLKNFKIDFY